IGRSQRLLRHLDDEISERFTELAEQKWDVHLGSPLTSVRGDGDNIAVELANGTVVSGDVLLVAVGRQPNGDLLGLDKAGVELDDKGSIV
ncbi:FAD-dependent oxidoreductase, partial [Rhodococcus erythropolis]|nr:FAD-dependent oxidoreductase [Rhodococcus erythropolis]